MTAMTTYQIDTTHSSVDFSIRHLVIAKVRGRFAQFSGTVELDETNVAKSSVRAEIIATSISTNEDKRDAHLRSADFFDVEQFPLITFASSAITEHGGELRITGALTIHGVTKEVELAVEQLGATKDPWGNQRVAFSAHGTINRKDFGLHWNQALEAGGVVVGEKVELSLDIQAVRAAT
jgi:polyisoprenoid-binding protein YceI